ncbi:probable aspartic proteinase GIP2 [Arachis stenosperma]|uniref:probable aspartic proteinase GIP2 n=1 Tax=Arachis stenosperma TaxID=217475 RepID=UPI0025ACFDA9|nr:probable aspartic proteinase GIP2 [Arachis stenosperma]
MASSSSVFVLLSFLFFTLFHVQISASSLILPVTKDSATLQYLTTLSYGTPLVPTNLVLDLGGSNLWIDCASRNAPSSSSISVPHRSIQCLTAKSHEIETQAWVTSLSNPEELDQPCQILSQNSITGTKSSEGELVQDLIALKRWKLEEEEGPKSQILFACSPTLLLKGLASGAKGIAGLGRSRSSFTSQIFDSLTTQRKMSFCVSSSSGVVVFGNMGYEFQPSDEILRSLTFTPLLTATNNQKNPNSQEYFINVNSIKIGGKKVSFNTPSLSQDGNGAMLSTVVPFTTLHSSIYEIFESAFLKAALAMNMTKVEALAPFGLCFSSEGNPSVPIIDFVLQSEMVKWSIHGRNSMVKVNEKVMCLGFLDSGVDAKNNIVIGGFQLEDVLVQIDLDTNMVGFSNSLLMKQTSCSDFKRLASSMVAAE